MPEDQTVYLFQPAGYVAEGKKYFVWKLGKALYGPKQSGHPLVSETQRHT